jgi:hypothetical protein
MRTEAVAGVYRLDELTLGGEEIETKEFKKKIRDEFKALAAKAKADGDADLAAEYLGKAKDFMDKFEAVAVVRLMRSVLRFRDLKDAERATKLEMVKEACRSLNIESRALDKPERFDAETPEGIRRWVDFIGFWVGKNLGILHGRGQVHMFLHMGNITLAGEIVDLDSVQSAVAKRKGTGKGHENEPFFNRAGENYFRANPELGLHIGPDDRFGLPKSLIKDFRDSCFSIKSILKNVKDLAGGKLDRPALADKMVAGYLEGFGGTEPFLNIGIKREKLIETLKTVATEVVGLDRHYDPIPPDEEKK